MLYKNGCSNAAVTDKGYYWGENKHLYRLMPPAPYMPFKTTNYSQIFGFLRQHIIINTDDEEETGKS